MKRGAETAHVAPRTVSHTYHCIGKGNACNAHALSLMDELDISTEPMMDTARRFEATPNASWVTTNVQWCLVEDLA